MSAKDTNNLVAVEGISVRFDASARLNLQFVAGDDSDEANAENISFISAVDADARESKPSIPGISIDLLVLLFIKTSCFKSFFFFFIPLINTPLQSTTNSYSNFHTQLIINSIRQLMDNLMTEKKKI